jgi:hypothetical protein
MILTLARRNATPAGARTHAGRRGAVSARDVRERPNIGDRNLVARETISRIAGTIRLGGSEVGLRDPQARIR